MPSFFAFQQGTETRSSLNDSSPLLGRFRAVPNAQRQGRRNHRNSLIGTFSESTLGRGYTSLFGHGDSDDSDEGDRVDREDMGAFERWSRVQRDLWLEPKQATVAKMVGRFWSRWIVLVILPAALVCESMGTM
jgi:hypothetical protein